MLSYFGMWVGLNLFPTTNSHGSQWSHVLDPVSTEIVPAVTLFTLLGGEKAHNIVHLHYNLHIHWVTKIKGVFRITAKFSECPVISAADRNRIRWCKFCWRIVKNTSAALDMCVCVRLFACVCVLRQWKGGSGRYSAVTNGNTQRRVLLNC